MLFCNIYSVLYYHHSKSIYTLLSRTHLKKQLFYIKSVLLKKLNLSDLVRMFHIIGQFRKACFSASDTFQYN